MTASDSGIGDVSTMADAAVRAREQGFDPIALHHPTPGSPYSCSCMKVECGGSCGKHPLVFNWQTHVGRSVDDVRADFERRPDANIGCVAGPDARRFIIDLDVDTAKGKDGPGELSKLEARLGPLPKTITVVTGSGGQQRHFRSRPGIVLPTRRGDGKAGGLPVGIDTRGKGGQGVLPPSLHHTGNRYRWLEGHSPDDIAMADLPPDWEAYFASLKSEQDAQVNPGQEQANFEFTDDDRERAMKRARPYLGEMGPAISGQGGHNHTFNAACRVVERVLTKEDAWNLLVNWNRTCEPPWSERELLHKLDGTLGKHPLGELFEKHKDPSIYDGPAWGSKTSVKEATADEETSKPMPDTSAATPTDAKPNRFHGLGRYLTAEEITTPPTPARFIWANRIPDKPGAAGSISGPGGVGKTALVVGLGLARSQGKPFLGIETKRGKTVFVTSEDELDDFRAKVHAWRDGDPTFNISEVASSVYFIPVRGVPVKLVDAMTKHFDTNHDVINELAEDILEHCPGADLIIMETVSRLTVDESNEGYSALITAAEELGTKVKATVLLVGHVSKAAARESKADAYASRGGGSLSDNGRFTLAVATFPVDPNESKKQFGIKVPPSVAEKLLIFASPKVNSARKTKPIILECVPTEWGLKVQRYDLDAHAADFNQIQDVRDEERWERLVGVLCNFIKAAAARGEHVTADMMKRKRYRDAGIPKGDIEDVIQFAIRRGDIKKGPNIPRGGPMLVVAGPKEPGGEEKDVRSMVWGTPAYN